MGNRYRVSLIPGDGIGPEITEATVRVLEATGVQFEYERSFAGQAAEERVGHPVPPETLKSLRKTKVGLKGPLIVKPGSPPVVIDSRTYGSPNAALRGECEAFANVRPAKRFNGVPGRFTDLDIDLIIVREVSEGVYVGGERVIEPGRAEAIVVATKRAAERVSRFSFQLARRDGRKKVILVHKANVLPFTDGLYLEAFGEVAKEFPETFAEERMIDAAAAEMVLHPQSFDVIVAPNQYGDILSDLSAAVIGGLGLGPGGNYGEEIAFFEACHGAAPDIAGRNIADPIALILSGAMMLDHLGEGEAARLVRLGVEEFLGRGEGLTPDLGGTGTTTGTADAIARLIRSHLSN
jgi:isocitrate dehydrogenase (NAD+)